MPQRRVALIGSGIGPWICTHGLREPVAKVTGLRAGGKVTIYSSPELNPGREREAIQEITENGKYELRENTWMQVEAENAGRNVICDILSKKVA